MIQEKSVRPAMQLLDVSQSRGDRISHAENCYFCYNVSEVKDSKYCENAAQ